MLHPDQLSLCCPSWDYKGTKTSCFCSDQSLWPWLISIQLLLSTIHLISLLLISPLVTSDHQSVGQLIDSISVMLKVSLINQTVLLLGISNYMIVIIRFLMSQDVVKRPLPFCFFCICKTSKSELPLAI